MDADGSDMHAHRRIRTLMGTDGDTGVTQQHQHAKEDEHVKGAVPVQELGDVKECVRVKGMRAGLAEGALWRQTLHLILLASIEKSIVGTKNVFIM